MALQHFYSRVPAKMSLFNKMDGYDTFVHSQDLSRECMEKDLAVIYDNKPTKEEALLIQKGSLPPVYAQFTSSDGVLYQSCISFLQSDYTGERAAYLVHSLIMNDDEKDALICNADNRSFNPEMFKHTLDEFDLVSFDSKPITDYPATAYKPLKIKDTSEYIGKYDAGMLKRLIYAMIGVACGKMKSLYLMLPVPYTKLSEEALDFLNGFLQIFPYHMRSVLSFITYSGDIGKYGSIKIKCMPESAPEIPTAKGVSVRMGKLDVSGISDENIAANASLVDFFFGLLTNDAVRREFLRYADYAVKNSPNFEKITLKSLSDLVFMFRQCSGLFDEKSVLPNDDFVYDFICVYDKNRTALTDEYRAQALTCLRRYSNAKVAIPKKIFSKVSSVYKNETIVSKRTVMTVVLDLIHTDVMRDKLFAFIKTNYDNEPDDLRNTIMQDICRVYYGGFLQAQILAFFDEHFENEPQEIRDVILEKLLLTIRTPNIQTKLLEFFDKYYFTFTDLQKSRFYDTFLEMLPECDDLARGLIALADKYIGTESDELKTKVTAKICELTEADQRRKEPHLMELLAESGGFCSSAIVGRVFGEWANRKIADSFLEIIWKKPLLERVKALADVMLNTPEIADGTVAKIKTVLGERFSEALGKTDPFKAIEAEKFVTENLISSSDAKVKDFGEWLKKDCLQPAISSGIVFAFDYKKHPDGPEQLLNYSQENAYIKDCEQFSMISDYFDLIKAAKSGETPKFIALCEKFNGKAVRGGLASLIEKQFSGENSELDNEVRFAVNTTVSYLRSGKLEFSETYSALREEFANDIRAAEPKLASDKVLHNAEEKAVAVLVSCGNVFYTALSDETRAEGFESDSEFAGIIKSYLGKYDKKKQLREKLAAVTDLSTEYQSKVNGIIDTATAKSGGIFAKLFGKK